MDVKELKSSSWKLVAQTLQRAGLLEGLCSKLLGRVEHKRPTVVLRAEVEAMRVHLLHRATADLLLELRRQIEARPHHHQFSVIANDRVPQEAVAAVKEMYQEAGWELWYAESGVCVRIPSEWNVKRKTHQE